VPASATSQTDWRVASVSRQSYYQAVPDKHKQASKNKGFSYGVYINHNTLEPESDIHVFAMEKSVSVVPMTIDLTAPVALQEVSQFFNGVS
jgi:broad specificity polyphosphatase/5'/3'-nucleotidase SurE